MQWYYPTLFESHLRSQGILCNGQSKLWRRSVSIFGCFDSFLCWDSGSLLEFAVTTVSPSCTSGNMF